MSQKLLYGPFEQLLTMENVPWHGPIDDEKILPQINAGILVQADKILNIGPFQKLKENADEIFMLPKKSIALPGFIDAHTHLCWAGERLDDYALRVTGKSYLDILQTGGGIMHTVNATRQATEDELVELMLKRIKKLIRQGIVCCEIKSGYGLTIKDELKILRAIKKAAKMTPLQIVPTCLAAHICPPEYSEPTQYIQALLKDLLPVIRAENLCQRIDIFVDDGAFTVEDARTYLVTAKEMGFDILLHADQFQRGASLLAAELHALSADHLEASLYEEANALRKAHVIGVALPGCSLGLGMPFAKAREFLDLGMCIAIASDWNPGSAPMGHLLTQASLLGAAQKLTLAETLAGITLRAGLALNMPNKGILHAGAKANFVIFATHDWREIFYHQGQLNPSHTIINGKCSYKEIYDDE